ncbi:ATP-binding protein [Kitasatospora sp. NPDC050543]|uniref:ATP-binding protein n=1 Tax=Kitasatospora sp. NPDC050543 TaxID=3364054 RepID=UPI00378F0D22
MTAPSTVGHQPHPNRHPQADQGGRAAALGELSAWQLGGPGAPRVLLVTGGPGSGRTRLITDFLGGGTSRPLVVGGAGLTSAQLLGRVADGLVPGAGATAEVYERLAGLDEDAPVAVVVLDVDRVGVLREFDEAAKATRSVLSPLAQSPGVRLLADLPRPQADWLADQLPPGQVAVLDLDEERWADRGALTAQAQAELGDRTRAGLAAALARTARSPLVVRLAARSLRSVPPDHDDPQSARPATPQELPASVADAIALHAARCGADELTLRRLLVPLALAGEGAALPRSLWVRLASAVAGRDLSVALLDGHALVAPFVVPVGAGTRGGAADGGPSSSHSGGQDGGEPAVRLLHPAVGAEVREGLGTAVREAQRRITRALLDAVPGGGPQRWAALDPAVRELLTGHALAAGQLPELLADPGFLLHSPQVVLRAAVECLVSRRVEVPPQARTWLRLAPLLIGAEAGPAVRAGLLEHAWHREGLPELDLGPCLPWRTLWWQSLPEVTAVGAAYAPDGSPAVLVALPAVEGTELAGYDAVSGAPLPFPERLAAPSEGARADARYALTAAQPGTGGSGAAELRIWARTGDRPVAVFLSAGPLAGADVTPDGILLLADAEGVGALRITA